MINLLEKLKVIFKEESLFYKYSRAIIIIAYIIYFINLGVEFKMYHILYPAILIGTIDGITYYFSGDNKKSKVTLSLVFISIIIVLVFRYYFSNIIV